MNTKKNQKKNNFFDLKKLKKFNTDYQKTIKRKNTNQKILINIVQKMNVILTTICIKQTTNFFFNNYSFTDVFFNIHRIVKCQLNNVNVKIVNQNMHNVIIRFKKKNQKIREKYESNF